MHNTLFKHNYIKFAVIIFIAALYSCNSHKELYYLNNTRANSLRIDSLTFSKNIYEPRIKPNDLLSITVNSETKGVAEDFNLPLIAAGTDAATQTRITSSTANSGTLQNYLVDKDGIINFPILGKLNVGGKTIFEAQNYITNQIYPQYLASRPIVNIRQLNFEVSVLGEVKNPGIYKSENGVITILDALAAAGDMTIYGRRDNILLVRIQEYGEVSMHKINLQDKNLAFNTDLFYLQQNDKLYIHPNKAKGNSSRFGTLESLGLTAMSIIISVVAIATR